MLLMPACEMAVAIDCDLKISAGAAGEKVTVNLVERDTGVDVNAIFFEPRFLQNKLRGELPEQFAHGFHALGASFHIFGSVAHGEENSFDSPCPRRVIEFRVAVGDVADAHESGCRLHLRQGFLEALQAADTAEDEVLFLSKNIRGGESFKESSRIPLSVVFHFDWSLALSSLYSRAWALSSVRAR